MEKGRADATTMDVSATTNTKSDESYLSNTTTNKNKTEQWQVAKDFFDAARDGDLDKVKECLSKGVGAEAKTDSGLTALHYASDKGHLEIVQYLIETCHVDMEAKDNDGETALDLARI